MNNKRRKINLVVESIFIRLFYVGALSVKRQYHSYPSTGKNESFLSGKLKR